MECVLNCNESKVGVCPSLMYKQFIRYAFAKYSSQK